MIIKEISRKVLQYIYDKTVGDDNNDELSDFFPPQEIASSLNIGDNDARKAVLYLIDKSYVRKEKQNGYLSITALGIDTIEENL